MPFLFGRSPAGQGQQLPAAAREAPKLVVIPIEDIRPNPYQPRRTFDEASISELKQSISESGLIQPLVVRKALRGYELIAGERRLRACKLLGMESVPCILRENVQEEDSALMALVENVQRRDLHYLEEAECYMAVLRTYQMTQEALAARLGKSQSFLANKLRLLRLPSQARRILLNSSLTERHARALLRIRDERVQLEILRKVVDRSLNVKDTERLVERTLSASAAPSQIRLLRLARDYRLFVNAVKCSAEQLKTAGMEVEYTQTDVPGGVDMLIRVRKKARAADGTA